jgi:hypothetical protein
VSEHLDSASKTSPEWLNKRAKVLRKWPQKKFTVKGTVSSSLLPLKLPLSRDSLALGVSSRRNQSLHPKATFHAKIILLKKGTCCFVGPTLTC